MFKNQLQELAQRSCFNLPSYACVREGPDHAPRFKATVNFNGEIFESPAFCSTLRQAEHAAAEVALNTLSKRGPSRSLAAKVLDETGIYKNLLQETAHRAGLKLPVYTTIRSGPGHTPVFVCTVELAGMSFTGDPSKTKKQAEKNAAMAAWSALKQLPHLGPSSSSTSLLEHEGSEVQEQVIIARVLASLQQPDGDKRPSQNNPQQSRHRSARIQRTVAPAANLPFYSLPFQSWAHTSFSPEFAMYQMWQQIQASQQPTHLLTLPAPPPMDPRFLPILQTMYPPPPGQLFQSVDQDPVSRLPFVAESVPCLPRYPDYSTYTSPRNQSQLTIQELSEEQNHREGKEWPNLREATLFNPCDTTASCLPPEQREDTNKNDSGASTEDSPETETKRAPSGFKQASCSPSIIQEKASVKIHQESQQQMEGKQRKQLEELPGSSFRSRSSNHWRPLLSQQNFDLNQSIHVNNPPPANSASLLRGCRPLHIGSSGSRTDVLKPRAPSLAAPVTIRTAIPVCSARPGAVNITGAAPAYFTAPAVRMRSVVPVCSAPPERKPDSSQVVSQEIEGTGVLNSKLNELQI
ncbi:double-stranded RNA-binding protein 2-like [Typha angustifolia]|uniref:double-stranded RNA-binding protein 2-like n=1 Tax=Typha angustifolia TaxID=59011 RepID=UPI003C303171